ncbi:MAG: HPr(Ser) kinase/phosphatase [Fibrobacter sp.]|uniref:HPr(Ser) kinase/phosphatase n=1 Tax=uncultured Fibrobacter sp. TaxID=261512 RepID=UPI00156D6E67|nr:HPr(Ser) kinase/phosphatase [uncultured Fibrobacter sp.]MBO4714012.1 HPr(Ser) kinase/phosphatase [Fibrobacter sp.]MBO7550057.1 HPr(Ser) kinase/phosphatase [Fibrobacter sp.]
MADNKLKDLKILHREKLSVRDFFCHYGKDLQMVQCSPEEDLDSFIAESGIHRPGLAMAGYTAVYSSQQIQVVGHTEWNYLESIGPEARKKIFDNLSVFHAPMWVVTHDQTPHKELREMCLKLHIPLFFTTLHTYEFNKLSQRILEEYFAPHAIIHGSLVDVYGIGMLYVGDSNVGKSECVLDLVESGHRMVADDVVHISHVGNCIVGRPDPLIRHHMEIRGVGILDIRSMFGIHAIRKVKKIEVIVELQPWRQDVSYDRTGLNEQQESIMGVSIPKVIIPVAPGKNLTVISEVIAMNALMKMNGQNVAQEFNETLMQKIKAKAKGEYSDDLLQVDPQHWSPYE